MYCLRNNSPERTSVVRTGNVIEWTAPLIDISKIEEDLNFLSIVRIPMPPLAVEVRSGRGDVIPEVHVYESAEHS